MTRESINVLVIYEIKSMETNDFLYNCSDDKEL